MAILHPSPPPSPLLSRPGAAIARDADAAIGGTSVAWHYGNPLGEQRYPTMLIDRSDRQVVRVTGPEAPQFLNNLLSQKLDDAPDGYSAAALDLDPQGRVLHHADLLVHDGAFYLDAPAPQAQSLHDYLTRMVFWSDVTIELTELVVLTLLGDPIDLPEDALSRPVHWGGKPRIDVLVPRDRLEPTVAALEAAGAQLAGLMAYTAERVTALEPDLLLDLDEKTIPHEVPGWIGRLGDASWPGAVHLEKGCYRGQETVARVHNLGRSPRVLALAHLDGSAPTLPAPGDELKTSGGRSRVVGRIGTVVHDADLGPIALVLVKRSAAGNAGLVAGEAGEVAVAIDADSIPADDGERPGRAAINRLKGL